MTIEQEKFNRIKTDSDYNVCGYDVDFKVYTDDEKKEVVLQYKESDSKLDWLFNLLFIPFPLVLRSDYKKKIVWTSLGYAIAYKSTDNIPMIRLMQAALKAPHVYRIVIRGWSFGSVMAKITDRNMEIYSLYPVDELTTFGDVKCWVNPFYKSKARMVHEYTTSNDTVTWCVPFYFRDKKCKVGPKFSIREMFRSEYYHTHYEDFDYTEYEK